MTNGTSEQQVKKEVLSEQLHRGGNPLTRYKRKVLGSDKGYLSLLQFECSLLFLTNLGGGVGYLLRSKLLGPLFKSSAKGTIIGRGVTIRTPGNISLDSNVAIDDHTLLDGGTGDDCMMEIGHRVVISKSCVIQSKQGPLEIGDECDIGAHCIISSVGGIRLARNVLIAGNCYIGGGRYNSEDPDVPIMYQGIYSRGPISIGEGAWIGASVTILDGVTIGKGAVIGAGSLVVKDIPDYAIALGSPATVVKKRF